MNFFLFSYMICASCISATKSYQALDYVTRYQEKITGISKISIYYRIHKIQFQSTSNESFLQFYLLNYNCIKDLK